MFRLIVIAMWNINKKGLLSFKGRENKRRM